MSGDSASGTPVDIEFRNWGVGFGRRPILAGLNLRLASYGVTVLMGPVGSGKSLLLKVLAGQSGMNSKTQGDLLLDGTPYVEADVCPALVQQHPRDLARNVYEVLIDGLREGLRSPLSPIELKEQLRTYLRHYDQIDLEEAFKSRLFDLPRGAMRRVLLMRAAFSNSKVLLVDEPTSGLTMVEVTEVMKLIRRLAQNTLCLVVLHHQTQAREIADRVLLLAGGRVQVDLDVTSFFDNKDANPVLAQFLRTGSCSLPTLGARPEDLAEGIWQEDAFEQKDKDGTFDERGSAEGEREGDERCGAPNYKLRALSFPPASLGPNGFRWLVPGKLAGCPMPGAMLPLEHDLDLLRNMGVTTLVNLTEAPMTQTAIPAFGLRTIHMRVVDREAPPLLWMKLLLAQIEKFIQQGEVVAVHCLAGLGRTGTVLGAWLVKEGLTAEEALRRLREIEPGFVQSRVQEELLHELEVNLLIRAPNL